MRNVGMIFAAGLGTRLRPLTDTCPKCLIDICGSPAIEYAAGNLLNAGVDAIVVNVHHHAQMVKDYIASADFPVPVFVSDESEMLLDTGGGLVKAAPMLADADNILIHNADVITDVNMAKMLAQHIERRADVTLLTRESVSSRALMWDSEDRLGGWMNVSTGEKRPVDILESELTPKGFCGLHIISNRTLERLVEYAHEPKFSITPFYADNCRELKILSYPLNDRMWHDIGRPEQLEAARCAIGKCRNQTI